MSSPRDTESHAPPLNETVRLAKYIVSLFSPGADQTGMSLSSASNSIFNSSDEDPQYYLPNSPKLKKDEAIIHLYILFVLLCYIIGTGMIVMKYMRKETSFYRFQPDAAAFTHMDSSEVWIKSTATSCETVTESEIFSEDDDSFSERQQLSTSDVTYV